MPPAWSPVAQMQNALEENEELWIKYANQPFCIAMHHHNSTRHVYPTFQASVRYLAKPKEIFASQLLNAQISFLESQFPSISIIEATSNGILSGFRANIIRATYILPFESDGEVVNAGVASWSYSVFVKHKIFTIGLSGPTEEKYLGEDEVYGIIKSIRIGAR